MGKKERSGLVGGRGLANLPVGLWRVLGGPSPVGAKLNKQLIEAEEALVPLSACLRGPGGCGSH